VAKTDKRKNSAKKSGRNNTIALALAGFTAAAILGVAVFAIASTSGGSDSFTANTDGLIQPGKKAPDFSAETASGGNFSLSNGGSQATLLVFFASWCPHCQNEAPKIADLEEQYDGLRVVMVGIDQSGVPSQDVPPDDTQAVRQFVDNYGIEGPAMYEPSLASEYGVSGFPPSYVLDGNRNVVKASAGEVPEDVMRGWVEEALGKSG
jgi:thiol-disulfide isomerase/thioredoxin